MLVGEWLCIASCRRIAGKENIVTIIDACARLLLAAIVFSFISLSLRREPQKLPICDAQRMCPHFGAITSRKQAACLECGKEPMPSGGN